MERNLQEGEKSGNIDMIKWNKIEDGLPKFPGVYDVKLTEETMECFNTSEKITWANYDILKKQFYIPGGVVKYYIEVTEWRKKPMTNSEKIHDMKVILNMLETIKEDTDEHTWAYIYLKEAIIRIKDWFEESEI